MVFQIHPEVPSIHLPWMLRQLHYLPRKSSLVLFLVCNYCIMAPIVEETFKAFLLRRVIVRDAECRRKKKKTNETVEKTIVREISVRGIVIYSLAIALGIKSADTARRVLLYSAPSMRHKTFFALARSVYPVQEICSVLTALNYAKSISLVSSSSFNASSSSASPLPGSNKQKRPSQGGTTLFRSILLHAMATMRGMKPLYVWDSRRPWDEIQLQAWNAIDVRSPLQMLFSSALNLLWFGALFKYVQVAIKKYVRLSQKFYNRKLDDAFGKLSSQRR